VDIGRGENKQTLWVDCSLWGDRAQKLGPYLTKGKQVALAGDFNLRTYAKKDGTPGAAITCDVQRLTLMGGRETGEQGDASTQVASLPMKPSAWGSKSPAQPEEFDSEIPF
jgi:single-stranded DNA-binding protein